MNDDEIKDPFAADVDDAEVDAPVGDDAVIVDDEDDADADLMWDEE